MVNWGNALLVAVLGMGIVFIVLILIMCVLLIMEKIFAPKKKTFKTAEKAETAQKAPETAPKITEVKTNDDSEIIAAITAAICASLNTSSYNIRIKSYRKLGESASAWNRASRNENVYKGF